MKSVILAIVCVLGLALAQNCGCNSDEPCCSQYGYCGTTEQYCDKSKGCQSGCWGDGGGGGNGGGGSTDKIENGVDRPGSDLSDGYSSGVGSATECQAKCAARSDCTNWAFNTCGDGSCWLKEGSPATTPNSCRASGVISGHNGNGGSGNGATGDGGGGDGGGGNGGGGNNPPLPAGSCFPLGAAKFSGNNIPNVTRSQWFCNGDSLYGFLGFSYPLEEENCNAYSNSYQGISDTMKKMKAHGATFVRTYLTSCRSVSVWKNLVKAGRDNNMGVIGMIWWDFGPSPQKMAASWNSILSVFTDPEVGKIAPYVIHSIEFNDEVGEEGNWWLEPLKQFRAKLAKFGVPTAISDDWDRSVYHSNSDKLNDWGRKANDANDQTHAHVIPYFHGGDPNKLMDYMKKQVSFWQRNNMKTPYIISQTEWPSQGGNHAYRPPVDNIQSFKTYWQTYLNNCQYFKQNKVSWFMHVFSDSQEGGLGLYDYNNKPKMDFHPKRC